MKPKNPVLRDELQAVLWSLRREFAVVANVLSGITHEIDDLSLQAVSLAGRHHSAA